MAPKLPIYMDNHATTPVDPRVVEAMLPFFTDRFGNAASRNHSFGWAAEEAVENARAQIARLINATPKEIIFTSGATESDNLAIKGVAMYKGRSKGHIITTKVEHHAVLEPCDWLKRFGFEVTVVHDACATRPLEFGGQKVPAAQVHAAALAADPAAKATFERLSYSDRSWHVLQVESVSLNDVAAQFGTPCYVYSRAALTDGFRQFVNAMQGREHLVLQRQSRRGHGGRRSRRPVPRHTCRCACCPSCGSRCPASPTRRSSVRRPSTFPGTGPAATA